jgi:hypothetical protein
MISALSALAIYYLRDFSNEISGLSSNNLSSDLIILRVVLILIALLTICAIVMLSKQKERQLKLKLRSIAGGTMSTVKEKGRKWTLLSTLRSIKYWFLEGYRYEIEEARLEEKPGLILPALRYVFAVLYLLSISKWITVKYQRYTSEEMKKQGKLVVYKIVDIYVIVWACVEVLSLLGILYAPATIHNSLRNLVLCLLSYRLLDIFQSWVKQFVLTYKWDPINANRSLILAFEGYLEIILIGAIIRFMCMPQLPIYSLDEIFRKSIMTMIANPEADKGCYAIIYTQVMFTILFLTVVTQQVLARISSKSQGDGVK